MYAEQRFRDRVDAGRVLAVELDNFTGDPDVTVLALPRGGVPVAYEVAQALGAPLDVFIVRKIGVPGHEELAMGAIASGGARVLNEDVLDMIAVPPEAIDAAVEREEREIDRRESAYRGRRTPEPLRDRIAIVVDDGLATGSTMRAAVLALRAHQPRRIVVAVPVAAAESCALLSREADEVVCARTPEPFHAVGLWYEDFTQTSDAKVRELLERAAMRDEVGARND